MLHEEATEPLPAELPDRVVLVVGPEGGLAPEELAAFAEAGARTVRLGAEVLRTSTAGVAARLRPALAHGSLAVTDADRVRY